MEPQENSVPQSGKRQSLEELLKMADQEAAKYESGDVFGTPQVSAMEDFSVGNDQAKKTVKTPDENQFVGNTIVQEGTVDMHQSESGGDAAPEARFSFQSAQNSQKDNGGNSSFSENSVNDVSASAEPVAHSSEVDTEESTDGEKLAPLKIQGLGKKVEEVVVGPSIEEIAKELEETKDIDEIVAQEPLEPKKHFPLFPLLIAIIFVLFTSFFFRTTSVVNDVLTPPFLVEVREGDVTQFRNDQIVQGDIEVGDALQTYDVEAVIEFFDGTRMILEPNTQMIVKGFSSSDQRIQVQLTEGALFVDDKDYRTIVEVFAHDESSRPVRAFYRSAVGMYYVARHESYVDVYTQTAQVYLVFEQDKEESRIPITSFNRATVFDSQQRQNVMDLEFSKAQSEFKIRTYFASFQEIESCRIVNADECRSDELLLEFGNRMRQGLRYAARRTSEVRSKLSAMALQKNTIQYFITEQAPYLILNGDKQENEERLAAVADLAAEVEEFTQGNTRSTAAIKTTLDALLALGTPKEGVWQMFTFLDDVLPTEQAYTLKTFLRSYEVSLLSGEDRNQLIEKQFVERNTEFYTLVLQREYEYITSALPEYVNEVVAFVRTEPDSVRLLGEVRILVDNMLIAVPKLVEGDIFSRRYVLEALELEIAPEEEREPLRLEFAQAKLFAMKNIYDALVLTNNQYLRDVYSKKIEQLIDQFQGLDISSITFVDAPVRVLEQDFEALRIDYLTLKGVAPDDEVEKLKETSIAAFEALSSQVITRIGPSEPELTADEQAQKFREEAELYLSSLQISITITAQREEAPRVFDVQGRVMGKDFTASFNVVTEAFSNVVLDNQKLTGVIDGNFFVVYLEDTLKPKEVTDLDQLGENTEKRNVYVEQIQSARRKRIFEQMALLGMRVESITQILPVSSTSLENYKVKNAILGHTIVLPHEENESDQITEHEIEVTFSYNIVEDRVYDIVLVENNRQFPLDNELRLQLFPRLVIDSYEDRFVSRVNSELMIRNFKSQGIDVRPGSYEVSGEKFTLFSIEESKTNLGRDGNEVLFQGNYDLESGNVYEATWTYKGNTNAIMYTALDGLKASIQGTIKAEEEAEKKRQQEEEEARRRAEEERARQEAIAEQERIKAQQKAEFEGEQVEFDSSSVERE